MDRSRRNDRKNISTSRFMKGLTMVILSGFLCFGCADDDQGANLDASIPESESWEVNSVHQIDENQSISPYMDFTHSDDRLYFVYYDDNPLFDEANADNYPYRYRLRYVSFNLGAAGHLNEGNKDEETVALLRQEGDSLDKLDIALSGSTPMVAYGVNKSTVFVEGADLNNQGDVMIGIRDGDDTWRNEIGAYGYVDPARNPVIRDGLAMADFSLKGDDEGNARLAFQFFYEGADSYNYNYRDLNYISQPVNAFVNAQVEDVADLEETVEGSSFQLPSGLQTTAGDACEMVIDPEGHPVVFYYFSNLNMGAEGTVGLRMARRNDDGEWEHEWIHQNVDLVQISAAVKTDGLLALVYTVRDYEDFDYGLPQMDAADLVLPYTIRYAEQVEVVVGVNADGDDIVERQWQHEYVDYVSICGRYCSMDLDSEDRPVVAFFDEMNFTETRFFSRIKLARRTAPGVWNTETIVPEDVGLTVNTSPYDVDPGMHDSYYIGKYNHLWVDRSDRVNLCSYSSISRKVYIFRER